MDDKEPNNIRVQCLYRSKADYIHYCISLIQAYDESISCHEVFIINLANKFAHLLNEINAQILVSVIDEFQKRNIHDGNVMILVYLDVVYGEKIDFIYLLERIEKLIGDDTSSIELFKRTVLESNDNHRPILGEHQTDDSGSTPVHRRIILDEDLLPYSNLLFLD